VHQEAGLGTGLWRTVRLLPGISRPLTALLGLAVAAGVVLPLGFLVASAALVGAVPGAVADGLGSPAGDALFRALAAVAALFVGQQVAEQVTTTVADELGRRLDVSLRQRAMRASLGPTGIAHLEDPTTLGTISLARNVLPGSWRPGGAVSGLAGTAAQRIRVLGAAAIVASFSVPLALVLLVVWATELVVILRYFFTSVKILAERQPDVRRSVYFRDLALTPAAAKEVRVFGLGPWIGQRFSVAWHDVMEPAWAERRQRRGPVTGAVVAEGAALALGLGLVGVAAANGEVDLERLVLLLGAARATLALSIGESDLEAAYGAAAVPALLDLESGTAAASPPASGEPSSPAGPARELCFEGVGFAYPGGGKPVFERLDLTIPAGQRLAIVGVNGAGKTTLVKLLARLYEPTGGRITVDGADLAGLDPAAWRARLAVLFQDFVHYELAAADNVGFGATRHGRPATDRLDRAAARAGATTVIAGLDRGWDTVLSAGATGGTDLSGGQWQRVALARALLAVDAGARVLVLDEPTANLDVRAEAEIYDRFLELTGTGGELDDGRPLTTIVISHRFSTVRRADRIVVLEAGRIIEDGTHQALLDAGGRYATMFGAQAARFADDAEGAGGPAPGHLLPGPVDG